MAAASGGGSSAMLQARFSRIIQDDPALMRLLQAARQLALPQWRLVAGCLYQTVWNVLTGRPRGTGIQDYDLIYFDGHDTSAAAEEGVAASVRGALPALDRPVDVRNQARVHLWFEDYFGIPYAPLQCADEAIDRYASATHAVGVRLEADGRLDVHAPFGLEDVFDMVVRPNPVLPNRATHERKAARVRQIWPEVRVIPWEQADAQSSP